MSRCSSMNSSFEGSNAHRGVTALFLFATPEIVQTPETAGLMPVGQATAHQHRALPFSQLVQVLTSLAGPWPRRHLLLTATQLQSAAAAVPLMLLVPKSETCQPQLFALTPDLAMLCKCLRLMRHVMRADRRVARRPRSPAHIYQSQNRPRTVMQCTNTTG